MTQSARENCRLGRRQELTPEGHEKAKTYFQQAIEDDPDYLPAYAEYSYCLVREFQNGWGRDPLASLDEALTLADKAVALGDATDNKVPNDFRSRWYRAMVHWNRGDFDKSFVDFEDARKFILPERTVTDNADLDADMAEALVYAGEPERAIALIEDARRRYPGHPYWYFWNLGRAYYATRRYQDALDAIAAIKTPPNEFIPTPPNDVLLVVAASNAQLGKLDEARAAMAEFSQNDPDWSLEKSAAFHYRNDSDRQHWLDGLRKAGLKER
ncbi:tetratricopeptide repeat protein [Sinorhizobium sp. BG8]|uniref:tetratricopeptide repeat protein n=1 Tax=Sinorhizobium sp. BG8 TaxID=2613773 RepID=UPI00193D3A45|nr:tetratricopeptide repeat protein [Sinorhizobium sp. BG8]